MALTDSMESCDLAAEIAILRRHKALIPPKNVLYIEKMERNDGAIGALPIREPYFSVAEFPVSSLEGVKSTREQWPEKRVINRRKVPPA
jgi:hypothetical protein